MSMQTVVKAFLLIMLALMLMGYTPDAFAEINNQNILDGVLQKYKDATSTWGAKIEGYATWLFWALVVISMTVTFGFMLLQKADIGAFFGEFIRFTLFVGFFFWLLDEGPKHAMGIMDSLMTIAADASGFPASLSPSGIVDLGFMIVDVILSNTSLWDPIDSAVAVVVGLIVLVVLALVSINMLLLLISAWILAYAGIFYLGFGGSKWTSDMAINYYKTVLGLAIQLFSMILLIGIGKDIIVDYVNAMSGEINMNELAVVLVVAITLLILVNKIPSMLSGIVNGSSVGNLGIGNFGAGAAIGAAAAAATAGAMGAAAMQSVATQTGGAGSAIAAAFKEAQQHMQTGTGMFAGSSPSPGGSASGGDFSSFSSAMSNPTSAIKAATTFAADMASNLGRGAGATAREAVANQMDSVKEAIAGSVGGQIASEIQNPGEARQERHDNKAIAAAEAAQQTSERKDRAADAREFLAAKASAGSMAAGSEQPVNTQPTQPVNDEVSAFVNKGKSED